jgi:uncharacterized protein with HEPN domain
MRGYLSVDGAQVWNVVAPDLPALKRAVELLLEEEGEGWAGPDDPRESSDFTP